MARGMSLHVGINKVSVAAFSAQILRGCENDATEMRAIVLARGFQAQDTKLLPGDKATFQNVDGEIRRAAGLLLPGDIFLFTFAGHGARLPDTDEHDEGAAGELDGQDETIVLYDRLLLDDYMHRVLWPLFKSGVRIVGVADSCHSGSALFALANMGNDSNAHLGIAAHSPGVAAVANIHKSPANDAGMVKVIPRTRALTGEATETHLEQFNSFYEGLDIPSKEDALPVNADLLLMAACQDRKTTPDGFPHGGFTAALLDVWNQGSFTGSYVTFMEQIKALVAARFTGQVPVLTVKPSPAFSDQPPFSI